MPHRGHRRVSPHHNIRARLGAGVGDAVGMVRETVMAAFRSAMRLGTVTDS